MRRRPFKHPGFTVVELMFALIAAALIVTIAIPSYTRYIQNTRINVAIGDMARVQLAVETFMGQNNMRLPASLEDCGMGDLRDPWGNPYQYLNIADGGPGIRGQVRKDRNLVPINTDFDLYSSGPDGESRPPLTAKHSRDDIVRAANGAFIGSAEEF